MRIQTLTTYEIDLDSEEAFTFEGPTAYSGKMTKAWIVRVRIVRSPDGAVSWRLFGLKIKRDGVLSAVPYEYWPLPNEARDAWAQIPATLRIQLPHIEELTALYDV